MLYPSRTDLPDHVPPERVVDYDTFQVDAPDGDFAGALVRLRDRLAQAFVGGGALVDLAHPVIVLLQGQNIVLAERQIGKTAH